MSTDDSRVAELRSLVSGHLTPHYDTHFNLLRWIQGNPGMPLDKIATRLRHHLLFRSSSWGIESIREKERGYHPLHKYWPRTKCGLSGVVPNCIVHVEQSGHVDFEGMVDNYSITEIIKASLHGLEEMLADVMKLEEETGHQASIICVMDAEGIEYSKKLFETTMRTMRALSEFMADHYVELFNRSRKRSLVGKYALDDGETDAAGEDEIEDDPSFWNNDQHSDFKMDLQRPVKVPKAEIMNPPSNLGKLTVKAGHEHWMEYSINKGDTLAFHITGNGNFGFAIVHADNVEQIDVFAMRPLYPVLTCVPGPLKVPIEDTVIASESGLYKVWFSNSRAWWSSLTVQYSIKVTKNRITE